MLSKSHIAVSELVLAGGSLITGQTLPTLLITSAGVWLGAQLPDIDHHSSKITKMFGTVGRLISTHLGHRTWTHSIWGIGVVVILALILPGFQTRLYPLKLFGLITTLPLLRIFYLGVAFGYFMHVLEDSFSKQGVCWTYPFKKFSYYYGHPFKAGHKHWWNYRTGGEAETVIRTVSYIMLLIVYFLILDR